jgi:lysophospholipase L1-like esterase
LSGAGLRIAAWVALGLLASTATPALAQRTSGEHWVATWGTALPLDVETIPDWVEPPPPELRQGPPAPSPIPPYPQQLGDQTVRMIVRTSLGGSRVRLTLANSSGQPPVRIGEVRLALRERESAIVATTDRAVTFGGKGSLTIAPGALVVSDPVDLRAPALTELAVSLYLPENTGGVTAHALGLNATYVAAGNAAAARSLPSAATNLTYFWLAGVEVLAAADAGTIVALGDSITDGFATTPNAHRAWPALLATKLQGDPATNRLGVVNAGISGNRVRRDLIGSSALARFDRDVLARAGVEWLVLLEGINDVTWSALPRAPQIERATAEQLIEGLSQLVDRAHAHGIKVMGATLTPMGGLWLHTDSTEAMRRAVNRWILSGGRFDAVVDFDAATRDPLDPARLRPELDSGDHIHPNDAGNAAMADAIDAASFERE